MPHYTTKDLDAIARKIGDCELVVSVSGGKDSTAVALLLKELGLPFRALHLQTGWETDTTDRFVSDVLPGSIGVDIDFAAADIQLDEKREAIALRIEEQMGLSSGCTSPMVRLILHRGMFSTRKRRVCTQELKVFPASRYYDTLDADPISVVGVRAAESARRAKMTEWEDLHVRGHAPVVQWRPIIDWSLADVIAIHRRHGAPLNAEYNSATRVGCMPCIHARKSDLRHLAERYPERVETIRLLEEAVFHLAAERYAAKGETFESLGYTPPAFFQAPVGRVGANWPIDDMIDWAQSAHNRPGQPALLHERAGGCLRWGYCEFEAQPSEELDNIGGAA